LTSLKKEFGRGEEESVKAAELIKLEQGGRTMEEFVQEFKRTVRGSGYEGRPLVEEFKRGINRGIRRKLMEAENLLASIEQWYRRAMALDRNWRESRREDERKKGSSSRSSEIGAKTKLATTLSVAKKANVSAGDNGAFSDGGSRKNKCSSSKRSGTRTGCRDSSKTGSLCNGGGSGEELLRLWRVRAYGLPLQEQRKREANGGKEDGIQWRTNRGDF